MKCFHDGLDTQCNTVLAFQVIGFKAAAFCSGYFSKFNLYISSRTQGTFLPLAEPLLLVDIDI